MTKQFTLLLAAGLAGAVSAQASIWNGPLTSSEDYIGVGFSGGEFNVGLSVSEAGGFYLLPNVGLLVPAGSVSTLYGTGDVAQNSTISSALPFGGLGLLTSEGTPHYFGLEYTGGAQNSYGWGEYTESSDGTSLTLNELYMNDTPGAPAQAGVVGGVSSAPEVPVTGAVMGLGGLLMVAVNAASRRRSPAAQA